MSKVRLERVPVKVANLGWLGFDHMHLAIQTDELSDVQDRWWVMEGLRDDGGDITRLGVLGWDGTTTLSEANDGKTGDNLIAEIGTPAFRGSNIIPMGGFEFEKWFQMAEYASDFEAQQYPYIAYGGHFSATATINSSSVIASLLFHVDVNVAEYFPTTIRISPGWNTLLGTTDDDVLELKWQFKSIYGGEGNDELKGQSGNLLPERLYGGKGDDTFIATSGINYYNGGEFGLDYVNDGIDTVSYVDIGVVTVNINRGASEHNEPDYYVFHTSGIDQFYSIESVAWSSSSDHVIFGPGIDAVPDNLKLKLGDQSSLDTGDHVDFSQSDVGLIVNADDNGDTVVQASTMSGSSLGIWLEGVEWISGSAADDKIYAAPTLHGVDAGAGDDLIDARLALPFEYSSPRVYDIEISGGEGSDTIVGSSGDTIVSGGAGADRFIVSALSSPDDDAITFTIEDADADDRVFVPYDFFNMSGGDFEGSALFPLLGAISITPGQHDFEDLPDVSNGGLGEFFEFQWQLQHDRHTGSDETQGVIAFTGAIHYNRDGADLLIHIYSGVRELVEDVGNDEEPWLHYVNSYDDLTETIVRVIDFQEGDLGIQFHDRGASSVVNVNTDHGTYNVFSFANWDAAVTAITNGGAMSEPIPDRPVAPAYELNEEAPPASEIPIVLGTGGDDQLAALEASRLSGEAGDDTLDGSGGDDVLDGGTGSDSMSGGGGDDVYYADSATDVVFESAGGGLDRVIASVSYAIAENVEELILDGDAVTATGNDGNNVLRGNDNANLLVGLGGRDTLIGGAGNDTLEGGAGADRYIVSPEGGDDVIRDAGAAGELDVLALDGYRPEDVTLFRLLSAPGDLVLALSDGAQVRIADFEAENEGIDRIDFISGEKWLRQDITLLASTAPVLDRVAPFARDDIGFLAASGVVEIPVQDLLANDRPGEGGPVSVVAVSDVSGNAAVSLLANGNLLLTTAEGSTGTVSFVYTIEDAFGVRSTAEVSIDLIANFAPVANAALDPVEISAGAAWSYVLPTGLFTDADGDRLLLSAALGDGSPLPDWLAFDAATGTLSGTPPSSLAGTLEIAVTASDRLAAVDASLFVTVGGGNHAPVAVDDAASTQQYVPIVIAAASLLQNDTDADLDPLSITAVGGAQYGSAVLDGDGNVLFTPEVGFIGQASFRYTVSDGKGGENTGDVLVDVAAPPQGVTLTGNGFANTLTGTHGNDSIEGRGGGDHMSGLAGDDVFKIVGNDGYDVFDGGYGFDIILGSSGNDVIGLASGSASLIGIEAIDGGEGTDTIRLSAGNDLLDLSGIAVTRIEVIIGAGGADVIIGSAGNDTINGGGAGDTLHGGDGDDTFLVVGSNGNDAIYGGAGFDRILGGAGNDTFRFASVSGNLDGVEVIDGGAGLNQIVLSATADHLDLSGIQLTGIALINGAGGNDTLVASRSDDVLRGGAGADIFVFRHGTGHDAIVDFTLGSTSNPTVDVVDLSEFAFASFEALLAAASQQGADTLITIDADTSVRLTGVAMTALQGDDFRLI